MEAVTNILLVDDHATAGAGLCALIDPKFGLQVVGQAGDGEAGFRAYLDTNLDVVIMDLSLPGISGLEAIRRVVARSSGAKILAFSTHEDTAFVTQALQAGSRDYVTKSASCEVVLQAIREIAIGNSYSTPCVGQRLAFQKTKGPHSPFSALTTREFEIFCPLAQGLNANEIGAQLALGAKRSPITPLR